MSGTPKSSSILLYGLLGSTFFGPTLSLIWQVLCIRLFFDPDGQTTPWSQFTYDQRNGRHHRTPPDSKRAVLDVHVYNVMAINSADIMTYTASALKAQLDIFNFVHLSGGKIIFWFR